ncbi:golgin subfamily A member 6-like protein 22 [Prorops nasuta]|uniref:golgin subfamily A member 6-like protein 22 n=1 Tax=Prorops nasuta TaxID=863751 RepID=UPI0034CDCA5A
MEGREYEGRGKEREKLSLGKLGKGESGGERGRAGSTGSIEEYMRGKRKDREEEVGEGWVFQKSAKMGRTPEKGMERGMEKIMEALNEIRGKMEGWKEGKKEIIRKMEEVRGEMEKDRKEWRGEIGELKKRMEKMERKEKENGEEEEKGNEERRKEDKELEERIRRLEWEKEKKERESRKNNIIIWGIERVEGSEGEMRKEVEDLMGIIGIREGVKGIKRVGGIGKGGRKGVIVEIKDREVKKEIMRGKGKLRGRKERIEEDMTWEERRVMEKVKRIAEGERRKGRRVYMGYMKVWIEGEEWRWREDKGELWNGAGKKWEGERKGTEKRREGIGGGEGRKEEKRKGRGIEIAFWNVAGVGNKEEDFWRKIGKWDIVCMVETWMEEKGWKGVSKRVPRGYRWWKQWAKKEERKGRAKGGILIGVREELGGKEEGEEGRHEGIMEIGIKIEEEEWRIIALYVGKGMRSIEEGIKRAIERGQGKRCLVGGDWNARIGELGGEGEEGEEMEEKRRSKDKVVNAEGMRMMDIIGEMGMEVWNGKVEGDREGEFTYVGHMGRSVIDYVVGDREARMGVKEIEVEVRTESDHLPIVVRLGREKRRRGRKMEKAGIRREWKEELVEEFRKKVEGMEEGEGEGVKERWEDLQEKMRGIVEGIKGKQKGGKENKRGWWDEECREKKKELREEMRRWMRGESKKEDYRKKKKQYMERCEEKRGKWREKWSKEIGKARGEKEIWEIIKRCRGKEESRVEEIRMDEWDEYFREMLEGKKGEKQGKEKERIGRRKRGEGREIKKEEIEEQIKRLKTGKAAGENGLENEVWKNGGKRVIEEAWKICNAVWRGEGWPKGWEMGLIVPIKKKGEGRKVEDYRGITLMDTMAKVYAGVSGTHLRTNLFAHIPNCAHTLLDTASFTKPIAHIPSCAHTH